MDVSKIRGTPKSSILIEFSIINHPFWDTTTFGNTYMAHHYEVGEQTNPLAMEKSLGTSSQVAGEAIEKTTTSKTPSHPCIDSHEERQGPPVKLWTYQASILYVKIQCI